MNDTINKIQLLSNYTRNELIKIEFSLIQINQISFNLNRTSINTLIFYWISHLRLVIVVVNVVVVVVAIVIVVVI